MGYGFYLSDILPRRMGELFDRVKGTTMAPQKIGLTYSRSSRDDGDETFSIDSQDNRNLAYASQQNIHVPEDWTFADEYTGFTLDRPAFNQVIRLAQEREVDCIIVYKVNRIARKSHLADWFLQEIIFPNGIELHIVEWGRSVRNTKDDLLLFGLQAQFSQFDAMDIKERTMRGRQEVGAANVPTFGDCGPGNMADGAAPHR